MSKATENLDRLSEEMAHCESPGTGHLTMAVMELQSLRLKVNKMEALLAQVRDCAQLEICDDCMEALMQDA